ncbi:class I SAM-dependent methyltransferase [Halobacillus mangrovi]|uniref:class I SAM-dependent methyltransferase n=1 Tax=Halobacillus mangrovi TaxID=402384 RepID=UPI003D963C8D
MSRYSFSDTDEAADRLHIIDKMFGPSSRKFIKKTGNPCVPLALDLGCGPGNTTRMIAEELQPDKVVGVDISSSHLSRANNLDNITFIQHDVTQTPFPTGAPDLIYARYLLTHLPDVRNVVENWVEELQSGGQILLEENLWIDSNHPVIIQYFKIVADLIKHNGGDLYSGRQFYGLSEIPNIKITYHEVEKVSPPVDLVAQSFCLNFRIWKQHPFITERYEPGFLNEMAEQLQSLQREPGDTIIEWGMSQLAIEKVEE